MANEYVEYTFKEETRSKLYRELKRHVAECLQIEVDSRPSARTRCLNNIQAILQEEIEVLKEDA